MERKNNRRGFLEFAENNVLSALVSAALVVIFWDDLQALLSNGLRALVLFSSLLFITTVVEYIAYRKNR